MMNRAQAHALTQLLREIRPGWDELTTTQLLLQLDGDLPDATRHAVKVAQDPANRTPRALLFTPVANARPASTRPSTGPAQCGCGRPLAECQANAVPMPHYVRTTLTAILAKQKLTNDDDQVEQQGHDRQAEQ